MNKLTEHAIQSAYFYAVRRQWPNLKLIYAIPNGGLRNKITAARMKLEGVTAGILDVSIDVAKHGYNGMKIEFKRPGGKLSTEQKEVKLQLELNNYLVDVHTDAQEAFERTKWYLCL